jgi:rhodanese-related sulfurtransferase
MATQRVDPQQAHALMKEGWTYVDVRTEQEFEGGHPAGSINIPINHPDFVPIMQARFEPDSKVIVGCMMGGRSARACTILSATGFVNLADATGGWGGQTDNSGRVLVQGWLDARLPTGGGTTLNQLLDSLTPGDSK